MLKLNELWPPDANSWLIGKDPDAGEDWGQKEKRVKEDDMAGWHHQFIGHELGQTLGDGEGQGKLALLQSMGLWRVEHTCWMNNKKCLVYSSNKIPGIPHHSGLFTCLSSWDLLEKDTLFFLFSPHITCHLLAQTWGGVTFLTTWATRT